MFVIGVTGGIGCGKSTVAKIARDMGLPVLDADAISRDVTKADGPAIEEIRETFGPRSVDKDGSMNRDWVASMAFRDKSSLDRLSAIIHRYVLAIMADKIRMHEETGTRALLMDVPIPVQHGFIDVCDQVWVVWTDDAIRIPRLVARGMRKEDIQRRIAIQLTREEYEELADHVILNNGTEEELIQSVQSLLTSELTMRGIRL